MSTEINSKVMPYPRHITKCFISRELEIWLVMLVSIFHKQNILLLKAHLKISQSLRQGSLRMCPCQKTWLMRTVCHNDEKNWPWVQFHFLSFQIFKKKILKQYREKQGCHKWSCDSKIILRIGQGQYWKKKIFLEWRMNIYTVDWKAFDCNN